MKFRAAAWPATAAVAGVLLASCSPAPAGPPDQQNRVALLPAPGAAPTTELSPLGTPDSSPKTKRPDESAQLAVTGVRVGSHHRFDRVVVDLSGPGSPGWYVSYVTAPMQETVGRPLDVEGSVFLNINVDGTVYPFEAGVEPTPVDAQGGSTNIVDVVNAGTHEGRSQILVGLRSARPYSVQVLDNPTRVVVDILKT